MYIGGGAGFSCDNEEGGGYGQEDRDRRASERSYTAVSLASAECEERRGDCAELQEGLRREFALNKSHILRANGFLFFLFLPPS